jgi:hypothetical protein
VREPQLPRSLGDAINLPPDYSLKRPKKLSKCITATRAVIRG